MRTRGLRNPPAAGGEGGEGRNPPVAGGPELPPGGEAEDLLVVDEDQGAEDRGRGRGREVEDEDQEAEDQEAVDEDQEAEDHEAVDEDQGADAKPLGLPGNWCSSSE